MAYSGMAYIYARKIERGDLTWEEFNYDPKFPPKLKREVKEILKKHGTFPNDNGLQSEAQAEEDSEEI